MKVKITKNNCMRFCADENKAFRFELENGSTIQNVRCFVVQRDNDMPILFTGKDTFQDVTEIYKFDIKSIDEVAA